MGKKEYFPYKWFDNVVKLKLPITELKKEHFNNRLKSDKLSNHKQEYSIQQLIKDLNITTGTFEEFHDFYLNIDVNGLADHVFEIFQETSINVYKSDPCHYFSIPSFSWDAMLLKTDLTHFDQLNQ